MKSSRFAILEVDRLLRRVSDHDPNNGGTGETFPDWYALLEHLHDAGVRTVSQLGLLSGGIAFDEGPAVLFVLRDPHEETASAVAAACGGMLSGLVWAVASEAAIPDWSNLFGAGVVCASAGVTGRPLIGLGVGELRQELAESRDSLHDALGYPPSICCPRPNRQGQAVDGLVFREARRAGYRIILEPGDGIETPEECRLSVLTPPDGASAVELARWIEGDRWLRIRFPWKARTRRWFA